jgi:hypothetical protein
VSTPPLAPRRSLRHRPVALSDDEDNQELEQANEPTATSSAAAAPRRSRLHRPAVLSDDEDDEEPEQADSQSTGLFWMTDTYIWMMIGDVEMKGHKLSKSVAMPSLVRLRQGANTACSDQLYRQVVEEIKADAGDTNLTQYGNIKCTLPYT